MKSDDYQNHPAPKKEELQKKVIPFKKKEIKPHQKPDGLSGAQVIALSDHYVKKISARKHHVPEVEVDSGKFSGWLGVIAFILILALLLAL